MVGGGRLLDLACGTGEIAFPLARHFGEVCAVDQEPESVAYGKAKSEETRSHKHHLDGWVSRDGRTGWALPVGK
jgi:ubiquinone/menaquinone biosynthesis C-methylase UbiE